MVLGSGGLDGQRGKAHHYSPVALEASGQLELSIKGHKALPRAGAESGMGGPHERAPAHPSLRTVLVPGT